MSIKTKIKEHRVGIIGTVALIAVGTACYKLGRSDGKRVVMKGLESMMEHAKKAGKAMPLLIEDTEGRKIPLKVYPKIVDDFKICKEVVVLPG